MRVGTIGYACFQGLGILIKAFYDHGIVTDVMVVDRKLESRPTQWDWYPGAPIFGKDNTEQWLKKLDVLLIFETCFDASIVPHCKKLGVRTVLVPMYECMPDPLPYQPDKIINPSLLDQQYYPQGEFIPVPVEVEWKQRTKAKVFVHNAGHGGLKGRNGTRELIEATKYIKSPLELIIRDQGENRGQVIPPTPNVHIRYGTVPYNELYAMGDVFVFPEKFNGLSLPLQEARAAGMLVMATDRFPMDTWLPKDPLLTVSAYRKNQIGGCNKFDEAVVDPRDIAARMDQWYGQDIMAYSYQGKVWGKEMSWDVLRPRWLKAVTG